MENTELLFKKDHLAIFASCFLIHLSAYFVHLKADLILTF